MVDEPPNSTPHRDQEIDAGEPVKALADLENETSLQFMSLIRRTIHRRNTASQVASFSYNVPSIVLLELWRSLMEILNLPRVRKGRQP